MDNIGVPFRDTVYDRLKMPFCEHETVAYTQQFLRAKAECFARLCHRLGVCLSVCHTRELYQNGAS